MTDGPKTPDEHQAEAVANAKRTRATPEVERLLKENFSGIRTHPASPKYDRGYTYAFEFSEREQDTVTRMMNDGFTFEAAFDAVDLIRRSPYGKRNP